MSAKWTRNDHLQADALTLGLGWSSASGTDPRLLKNAIVSYWLHDAVSEPIFDAAKHLRFLGIATEVERAFGEDGASVTITAHDYTSLFVTGARHFPSDGVPDWTDTLRSAWERICDHVGFFDVEQGEIVSSVKALRDRLVFRVADPSIIGQPIGRAVAPRFLAMSKPQFGAACDGWHVWQSLVGMLGLMSYIDKDQCIVTDTTTYYDDAHAAKLLYGKNLLSLSQRLDATRASKGIILRSFDPLAGRIIEGAYPPPGDPRIKLKRAKAGRGSGATAAPADLNNAPSSDYDTFDYFAVSDQQTLEIRAREAYEERSRQELEGRLTTGEMLLDGASVLDLHSGSAIQVDPGFNVDPMSIGGPALENLDRDALITSLIGNGYGPDMAGTVADLAIASRKLKPVFHVKTMTVDFGPERFEIDISFHNVISLEK